MSASRRDDLVALGVDEQRGAGEPGVPDDEVGAPADEQQRLARPVGRPGPLDHLVGRRRPHQTAGRAAETERRVGREERRGVGVDGAVVTGAGVV